MQEGGLAFDPAGQLLRRKPKVQHCVVSPTSPARSTAATVALCESFGRLTSAPGVQVPECTVNVLAEGSYSKRFKACDFHRKQKSVSISGVLHRFCQQCSRFEVRNRWWHDSATYRSTRWFM
jgi:hypothetical protein